jgi:ketosteroid isomerase-like protein
MSREDVELISRLQAAVPAEDLKKVLDSDSFQAAMDEFIDPDAEVRFVDPEGGALGDLRVPVRGTEGLRAGWAEWLEPWEKFGFRFERALDAGDGKVLSLAELRGRAHGGAEISHPGAALFRVRAGRIVAMDFYMDRDQARRDAGLA